ncbi:twin-arginine translocation signal domain-containing protein [Burkholderia plantarii]|uniref:twin-arginine translocation signal domain-containing protein n=1 Tax=Burkholderia plantarii TaxID=41899 RepID=UPI001F5B3277|nr:twin-arginine translocation signal domain-containing protein [Burkholderia plantarii]
MSRRNFIRLQGALVGSALLGGLPRGCRPDPTTRRPRRAAHPADHARHAGRSDLGGERRRDTYIIASLNGITQSAFVPRCVDYAVEAYGAQPCSVVAQTSPYTTPPSRR